MPKQIRILRYLRDYVFGGYAATAATGGPMGVILSDFSYYFSVTGGSGGLYSLECTFEPPRTSSPDAGEMKEAVRLLVERYTRLLDQLYGGIIQGKKQPTMTDTPRIASTGYQYSGRLTRDAIGTLPERLQTLFAASVAEPYGELSTHRNQNVEIECSFSKRESRFNHFEVRVKFQMSHVINVCFFHFTEQLEKLVISNKARANMEQLRRTLQSLTDRGDTDYYAQLIEN